MVALILPSLGWPIFAWISLSLIFCFVVCLVGLLSCFLMTVLFICTTAFPSGLYNFWDKKASTFLLFQNLVVSRNPLPDLFAIFSSKRIHVEFFLRIRVSPSDVIWKSFCSACVNLNRFACRPGITAIFYNVM